MKLTLMAACLLLALSSLGQANPVKAGDKAEWTVQDIEGLRTSNGAIWSFDFIYYPGKKIHDFRTYHDTLEINNLQAISTIKLGGRYYHIDVRMEENVIGPILNGLFAPTSSTPPFIPVQGYGYKPAN